MFSKRNIKAILLATLLLLGFGTFVAGPASAAINPGCGTICYGVSYRFMEVLSHNGYYCFKQTSYPATYDCYASKKDIPTLKTSRLVKHVRPPVINVRPSSFLQQGGCLACKSPTQRAR